MKKAGREEREIIEEGEGRERGRGRESKREVASGGREGERE